MCVRAHCFQALTSLLEVSLPKHISVCLFATHLFCCSRVYVGANQKVDNASTSTPFTPPTYLPPNRFSSASQTLFDSTHWKNQSTKSPSNFYLTDTHPRQKSQIQTLARARARASAMASSARISACFRSSIPAIALADRGRILSSQSLIFPCSVSVVLTETKLSYSLARIISPVMHTCTRCAHLASIYKIRSHIIWSCVHYLHERSKIQRECGW